ncbi:hypothetical protein [Vibrio hibernica]|uniref:hypothetical protein n=1 Tax=Vibrio hibernica TaxID=2587465 RepID=UPI0018814B7A|nr:hypothetical protein [Vibrio hibernica]
MAASLMLLTKSLDIQHDSKLKYVFLVSLVLASFTWQSTSNEGRYAILNGDPNYTSVIMFTLIISMGSFFQKKRFRILVYILLFFLFYLTLSRMLMLMVLIYFVVRCFKSNFIVNSLGVLIFLSTMLTQLFVFLFLYSSLGQGGDGFIISNLNDGSNMERVKAFKIAYEYFVYDLNTILFGNSDYLLGIKKGYFLQVHNGFFGMLVYFGVIFTTLFYVVLFWFFIKADDDLKPVIYSLTLASGILGPWVFGTSMVLILLSYKQSDTRRLELK